MEEGYTWVSDLRVDRGRDVNPGPDARVDRGPDVKAPRDLPADLVREAGKDLTPDRAPVKDVAPDRAPVKDLPPLADLQSGNEGTTSPLVVTLDKPTKGHVTHRRDVELYFIVKGGSGSTVPCYAYVDNLTGTNVKAEPGTAVAGVSSAIKVSDLAKGDYQWYVGCKDGANSEVLSSEKRKLSVKASLLSGCSGALDARAYYQVDPKLGTMTSKSGDCFVIKGEYTELDGSQVVVTTNRYVDLFYHRCVSTCEAGPFLLADPVHVALPTGTDVDITPKGLYPLTQDRTWDAPTAADFNRDDRLDLVMNWYSSPGLTVLFQKTAGAFDVGTYFQQTGCYFDVSRVVDFDSDGRPDLFSAGDGCSEVYLRNTGVPPASAGSTQGFSSAAADGGWTGSLGAYSHAVTLADFNDDRIIDVVVSNGQNAPTYVSLLTPRKAPGFGMVAQDTSNAAWSSVKITASSAVPPQVGDFDGDNQWDLVVAGRLSGGQEECHPLQGSVKSGTLQFSRIPWGSTNSTLPIAYCRPVGVLDINGDGHPDLASLHIDSLTSILDSFHVHTWDQKNARLSPSITAVTFGGPGVKHVLLRDLNRDDLPDLITYPVAASGATAEVKIYLNKSTPSLVGFQSAISLTAAPEVREIAVADFDNNGYPDLVVGYQPDSTGVVAMRLYLLDKHPTTPGGLQVASGSKWIRQVTGKLGYMPVAMGRLLDAPARGVVIEGKNALVKDFGALRGFSVGVDINPTGQKGAADGFQVDDVGVEDSDIAAFRVRKTSLGKFKDVELRNVFRGRGMVIEESGGIVLDTVDLCPAPGYDPRHTMVSLACTPRLPGTSGVSNASKSVTVRLNNGCTLPTGGWSICP